MDDKRIYTNIYNFMKRSSLQGGEVPIFNECMFFLEGKMNEEKKIDKIKE